MERQPLFPTPGVGKTRQQHPQHLHPHQQHRLQHLHPQQQQLYPGQMQLQPQLLHPQQQQSQRLPPQQQQPPQLMYPQHLPHSAQLQFPPSKQQPLHNPLHREQEYSRHHGQPPPFASHIPEFLGQNESQTFFPTPGVSSFSGQQGQPPPSGHEAFSALHISGTTELISGFRGPDCSGNSLYRHAEVDSGDCLSPSLSPATMMNDYKQQDFQRSLESDLPFHHPDRPPVQTNHPFSQPDRSSMLGDHPFSHPERPPVQTNHPFSHSEKLPVQSGHPFLHSDRPPVQSGHPFPHLDKSPVQSGHPFSHPDRPPVQSVHPFPPSDRPPVQSGHPFPHSDRPPVQSVHPFPPSDRLPVQSGHPFSHPDRLHLQWQENPELVTSQKAWINEERLNFLSKEGRNEKSPLQDENTVQHEQDMQWLSNFLANRRQKAHPIAKAVSSPSVSEARKLVYGAFRLVSELTLACQELEEMTEDGTAWSETYQKATSIHKDLEEKMKILSEPGYIDEVKKKLEKLKKRRFRLQVKKQENPEEEEAAARAAEREAKIDKWRTKCIQEVEEKNRERELKAAADSVLSEVRKKQADTKRMVDVLRALEKLRKLRKEAAGKKGISPPPSADQTFEQHVARLRELIRKRTELYDAEERALRVMLEGEQEEERKREQEKKLKKEREKVVQQQRELNAILFGDPGELPLHHPLLPFRQYYLQAQHSVPSLLQIRHAWDQYLVPSDCPEGSCIPQGWVLPSLPSSDTWASAVI
ncbi:programmed cell death protein 7 isoform X2 [Rhinatrema bivittatum]|uniref:programmed cell death protein 7 isoform X2 n=1 Tax=Rhinatrema bivittatum TaxID=194408 RepID=UPI00112E1887|nr:programmed cell death protein 7 isoform X2 [Rhinatrema bivittatum]